MRIDRDRTTSRLFIFAVALVFGVGKIPCPDVKLIGARDLFAIQHLRSGADLAAPMDKARQAYAAARPIMQELIGQPDGPQRS